MQQFNSDRRAFLARTAAVAVAGALVRNEAVAAGSNEAVAAGGKMRGIYPIAQTPFTPDNKLDLAHLGGQAKFCTRRRVPGLVWPQMASGWTTLSEAERLAGAEALLAAAHGTPTQVVIGLQAHDGDRAVSSRLAKHAAANGANAVIALVSLPGNPTDQQRLDYYKALGDMTDLPLVVQTDEHMSVDLVADICNKVPTVACVKDEAGDPLERIGPLRERTGGRVAIFTGTYARALIVEMQEKVDGNMPSILLCDLLQRIFELWYAGKQQQAFELYGRYQAYKSIPNVDNYTLSVRGIFPKDAIVNRQPSKLRPQDKQFIDHVYREFMKPYVEV